MAEKKDMNKTKTPVSVSIFGSCVTRDLLEFDIEKTMELKSYVCRQSVVSAVAPKVECSYEEINLISNFQKRQVFNDFEKNTFEILKNDNSEYLIIDLIDERFSLLDFEQSYITYSAYLMESGLVENPQILKYELRKGKYYLNNRVLDSFIEEFCIKILEIYSPRKIIIHKAYMMDEFLDKAGKQCKFSRNYLINNKITNKRLQYMYMKMIELIGTPYVIDICKHAEERRRIDCIIEILTGKYQKFPEAIASENHKWGLAPMHYHDAYYKAVLNDIIKIIAG